ncbi:nicotinate-nucleotide adenylyltransferase [Halalkalibacter sp. APA_J-10(15)]|uniref:nicotinate-nucleotide adenylyltransferase n=1 Tax=Halalkalibacter sp. APA_J-10(15) TaxID=2933805 RepID=UPI001FF504C0|nr:nicotinate-nucleotide adenylyltransferase [Halalkalibacter sp. APA_J-10(15)]MCK0471627.1 nicotinate-nucleotide adenylyltransferase [Halalkalibacter sp. APA_J-10(15)]
MKRIALFGGTFNPPHLGHMLMAQEALYTFELDEVWFLPVGRPPHKSDHDLESNQDRLDMLLASIDGQKSFHISTVEFEREGRSYTIDTVHLLKEMYPTHHFSFLIGGDMIDYLPKWERINELLKLVPFIGVSRPGAKSQSSYTQYVKQFDMVQVDISSSSIRKRVKEGKPITYMVRDRVESIIKERGLYGS